jgi:four helix bundle protein
MIVNYSEWLSTVPSEITNDPIWKLEVYRLALFAGDIGWPDVNAIYKKDLMQRLANQLYGSLGSISANLTEGYSRSKGLDRARFFEYSLGSSREARDWYYKARHVISVDVFKHRMALQTKIISMLVPMIPHQRAHSIREDQAKYLAYESSFNLDMEIPFP